MEKPPINLIMDSGAFTAWKLGKPIALQDYCNFLDQNKDWITDYINLDEIIPSDPEEAARRSMRNLEWMMERGYKPMPVFHAREDISWLKRMVDMGCPCICLAGLSLPSQSARREWYNLCWNHLVNTAGRPIVKVHALGEGREAPLLEFPWFSADSTSWAYASQRYGKATLTGGMQVSLRNDGANDRNSPDIRMLDDNNSAALNAILDAEGISRASLETPGRGAWTMRSYLEVLQYQRLQTRVNARHPIRHYPTGFFHGGYSSRPAVEFSAFRMFLVRSNNVCAPAVFWKTGMLNILFSYAYMPKQYNRRRKGNDEANAWNADFVRSFLANPAKTVMGMEPYSIYWDLLEAGLNA